MTQSLLFHHLKIDDHANSMQLKSMITEKALLLFLWETFDIKIVDIDARYFSFGRRFQN